MTFEVIVTTRNDPDAMIDNFGGTQTVICVLVFRGLQCIIFKEASG